MPNELGNATPEDYEVMRQVDTLFKLFDVPAYCMFWQNAWYSSRHRPFHIRYKDGRGPDIVCKTAESLVVSANRLVTKWQDFRSGQ
jgi:hypothetical protein